MVHIIESLGRVDIIDSWEAFYLDLYAAFEFGILEGAATTAIFPLFQKIARRYGYDEVDLSFGLMCLRLFVLARTTSLLGASASILTTKALEQLGFDKRISRFAGYVTGAYVGAVYNVVTKGSFDAIDEEGVVLSQNIVRAAGNYVGSGLVSAAGFFG